MKDTRNMSPLEIKHYRQAIDAFRRVHGWTRMELLDRVRHTLGNHSDGREVLSYCTLKSFLRGEDATERTVRTILSGLEMEPRDMSLWYGCLRELIKY